MRLAISYRFKCNGLKWHNVLDFNPIASNGGLLSRYSCVWNYNLRAYFFCFMFFWEILQWVILNTSQDLLSIYNTLPYRVIFLFSKVLQNPGHLDFWNPFPIHGFLLINSHLSMKFKFLKFWEKKSMKIYEKNRPQMMGEEDRFRPCTRRMVVDCVLLVQQRHYNNPTTKSYSNARPKIIFPKRYHWSGKPFFSNIKY